jgi:hypothetical protein
VRSVSLCDRDRLLLAFADLWSHGVTAWPATDGDAAALDADLRRRYPAGLGSCVYWKRSDDRVFDAAGTLTAPLALHCSSEEALTATRAACQRAGVAVIATQPCVLAATPPRSPR